MCKSFMLYLVVGRFVVNVKIVDLHQSKKAQNQING